MATPPQRIETKPATPALRVSLSAVVPWASILGLVALVLGGLAANAGSLLEQIYPLAALAVGALLYWRYPALYLGFAWWIWLLTPEVRRLVDYQQGWNPENLIMLAPLLVTGLTFFTLLRHLPKLQYYRLLPFGLVFLGLFYGYSVGIYRGGWQASTYDLLNWLVPVVFAFYLTVHWRNYPRFRQAIQRTFVWSILVMGVYGTLQFLDPPMWDQYWMTNAPMSSIGSPEPFEVRVFSTLNAPGPFAVVVMAGLLLLSGGRGGLVRWTAAGAGYVSFLLSLVRAAWGGWVVGLIFIALQRGRFSPRLLVGLVITGLIALPLLTVGPVADIIDPRLQTVTNLQQDTSANERQEFYLEFAQRALLNPAGEGLGRTGVATKLSTGGELGEFGNFDSGLLNIPFVLGWPGALLYVGGLAWLLFYAMRSRGSRSDLFAVASRGIVVAVLTQLLFVNTLTGVTGMVFWCFLALAFAGQTYQSRALAQAHRPRTRKVYGEIVSGNKI